MIEKIVLDWLDEAVDSAYMEIPTPLPDTPFVVIEKTGSGRTNHIDSATIAVQSYAGSMLAAAQLNEAVKAAMEDIVSLPEVSACRLNSDYNFTDTDLKRYRYQAVFDITHY